MATRSATRRNFLLLSSAAAAASAWPAPLDAAWVEKDWSATEKANVKVVMDMLHAWERGDAPAIGKLFAPDAAVRLSALTSAPAKTGKETAEQAAGMFTRGTTIRFELLHIDAQGPLVVTRRIDRLTDQTGNHCEHHGLKGVATCADQIVGVFVVKDGKVQQWFDFEVGETVPEKAPVTKR